MIIHCFFLNVYLSCFCLFSIMREAYLRIITVMNKYIFVCLYRKPWGEIYVITFSTSSLSLSSFPSSPLQFLPFPHLPCSSSTFPLLPPFHLYNLLFLSISSFPTSPHLFPLYLLLSFPSFSLWSPKFPFLRPFFLPDLLLFFPSSSFPLHLFSSPLFLCYIPTPHPFLPMPSFLYLPPHFLP